MEIAYNRYLLAADAMLLLHFAFVAFVVLGFVFIWTGRIAGWTSVRNATFRITHLAAMGAVLLESLLRMVCPLTEWENALRVRGGEGRVYESGFVEEWIHRILFFEFSERTFLVVYLLFFLLILFTFWRIPPLFARRRK